MNSVVTKYFETYLDANLTDLKEGELRVCPTRRRERKEDGWSRPFALWVFLIGNRGVISVRPDLANSVRRAVVPCPEPRSLLSQETQHKMGRACGIEFTIWNIDILSCDPATLRLHQATTCRRMVASDVEAYLDFKKRMWPNCDADCCARDILRNIGDGIAHAVFADGMLVSQSSAPQVGIMQDEIEEPGVETLPEYRRQGFGKAVLSNTTKAILGIGRHPIYRLSKANTESLRTAQAVGYQRIAECVRFAANE